LGKVTIKKLTCSSRIGIHQVQIKLSSIILRDEIIYPYGYLLSNYYLLLDKKINELKYKFEVCVSNY
jgi:hypothetical protein